MIPIKVKASADFIQQFMDCEEASYEDTLNAERSGEWTGICPEDHTYAILQRHKTVIEIRNTRELLDVYYRLGSGLISCSDGDHCRRKQARRIQSNLAPSVEAVAPDYLKKLAIDRDLFF